MAKKPLPESKAPTPARVFLVADIRGYTAYTDQQGDLAASRLAQRFATIAGEGVTAWSGRLVELRGDEALAVFDDPRAALHAAMELQDAFSHESSLVPAHPLPVGMGLDIGAVVPVGDGYRGRALNLASRLCSISAAGVIHASVELVERADASAGSGFELVDGLELKGFGQGLRAFKLKVGADGCGSPDGVPSRTQEPTRNMPAGLETDLVLAGRESEMRWLGWHWRRARTGHGRAVVVQGPDGVGKRRLASELATAAAQDGARVSYRATTDPEAPASAAPSVRGAEPGLAIVETRATSELAPALPADLHRQALLVLIVSHSAESATGLAGPLAGRPTLEVVPLGLDALRELASNEAPDVVDELPLGRILDESQSLRARWSVTARAAAHEVDAAGRSVLSL